MKLVVKSAELSLAHWISMEKNKQTSKDKQKKTTQKKQVKGCSSHQRKIQFSSKLIEKDLVLFAMKTHHCGWNSKAVGRNKRRSFAVQDTHRQQALWAVTLLLSSTSSAGCHDQPCGWCALSLTCWSLSNSRQSWHLVMHFTWDLLGYKYGYAIKADMSVSCVDKPTMPPDDCIYKDKSWTDQSPKTLDFKDTQLITLQERGGPGSNSLTHALMSNYSYLFLCVVDR